MRAGGSPRFGMQAGPKRKPVIELIKSRVIAMRSRANRQGRNLSGFEIHSQLLSEGYNVGINSVYVCLRVAGGNNGNQQRTRNSRSVFPKLRISDD
jgi:hypothetical protein